MPWISAQILPRHRGQEATVNLEFNWFEDAINRVYSVREVEERCVMLVSRRSWTISGASSNRTWVSYVHIHRRVPLRNSDCASSSLMALCGYDDLCAKNCVFTNVDKQVAVNATVLGFAPDIIFSVDSESTAKRADQARARLRVSVPL